MFLKEFDRPLKFIGIKSILKLLEVQQATMVNDIKNTALDLLLSYTSTAPASESIPLDKFLQSLAIPGLDINSDKNLVVDVLNSLSDVVKEVDVGANKIVLKNAMTVRNKKSNPEKNKEKVSKMAARAIKKRTK